MASSTLFHIVSRGVDKRKIFMDGNDYQRFVHDLFEFNNQKNTKNLFYRFRKLNNSDIVSRYIEPLAIEREPRKLLVSLHAFCLMPNHYHLLLSEQRPRDISLFMKKLNIGYAKYFNERYERTGTLFEGRYKFIPITSQAHFLHIPYYIHCNPLDFYAPKWREREISNYKEALAYLESYRWSSHRDYLGIKNFASVTQRELLLNCFGGANQYKKDIQDWLRNMEWEYIKTVSLEY